MAGTVATWMMDRSTGGVVNSYFHSFHPSDADCPPIPHHHHPRRPSIRRREVNEDDEASVLLHVAAAIITFMCALNIQRDTITSPGPSRLLMWCTPLHPFLPSCHRHSFWMAAGPLRCHRNPMWHRRCAQQRVFF